MSTTNDLTRQIIQTLSELGAYAFRVNDTGVFDVRAHQFRASSKKGISDILAVYNSKFIAIEIKTGKDKLRPEQIGFIKNVEHCGGICLVVKDFEDFRFQWFDKVKK